MRDIQNLLDNYLSKQTQYAVNIVGQWGKGKTYYYKNVLEPQIMNTATLVDNTRNYNPVYISLFGLKSVDEIQIKAFNELLYRHITPKKYWFQSRLKKTLKITVSMMRILFKGFQVFKGGKEVKGFSADISALSKNVIDTNHILICFDDLERKSPVLSIEDFTGYINTLVEQNIKVLIICNEDKITEENYKYYKEKIIDITYEYDPEAKTVINSIVKSRYTSSPAYSLFLDGLTNDMKEILEKNENNYRHLIYGLDNLHDIYSFLKQNVLDSGADWAASCNEQMEGIAKFIMSVSTEFKASNLTYTDRDRFKAGFASMPLRELMEQADSPTTRASYATNDRFDRFINKYYPDRRIYKHYNSLFDYITSAKKLTVNQFESEFKQLHYLHEGRVQDHDALLKQLAYPTCLDMEEDEFHQKTERMIGYAVEGKYRLTECLVVFYYAKRFNNLLDFDLTLLADNLIAAMSKIAEDEDLLKKQELTEFDFEKYGDTDANAERIRKFGLSIFEAQEKKKRQRELTSKVYFLTTGINELYQHYHDAEDFRTWFNHYAVLEKVDAERIVAGLLSAKPHAVKFFESLFKDRYAVYGVSYMQELNTLYHIRQKLTKYLEHNTVKTKHRWAVESLVNSILKLDDMHGIPVIS